MHLHFKFFLQRLHQLATLKEIVELLQKGLVHVNDFRRFHQHLADASYHNKEHWEAQRDTIEKDLPTFAKEQRLSQLPFFVASDKGPDIYDVVPGLQSTETVSGVDDLHPVSYTHLTLPTILLV